MKGKCPEWGKVLVKDVEIDPVPPGNGMKVRCPSCREHYHQLTELEWSE